MKTAIAGAFLIGALALSPNIAWADDTDAAIEQLITNSADSPSDHLALAKYYRGKAADARAAATRHEKMASSYGGVKMAQKTQMEAHCNKLSKQNTAMAAEFDALAKLHDEDAKKPQ